MMGVVGPGTHGAHDGGTEGRRVSAEEAGGVLGTTPVLACLGDGEQTQGRRYGGCGTICLCAVNLGRGVA